MSRNVERGTWQSHPWWKRGRLVRSVNQAIGQELSEQDQNARKTSWIFEAVDRAQALSEYMLTDYGRAFNIKTTRTIQFGVSCHLLIM